MRSSNMVYSFLLLGALSLAFVPGISSAEDASSDTTIAFDNTSEEIAMHEGKAHAMPKEGKAMGVKKGKHEMHKAKQHKKQMHKEMKKHKNEMHKKSQMHQKHEVKTEHKAEMPKAAKE